jgi:serine/threonine protein kinase/formylglycine-generating enzyme required for sulfatase activity
MSDREPPAFAHFRVYQRADGTPWELGRGGMGVTYRALDMNLRKDVALKVIRTERTLDQIFRQRFQREARSAAQIQHLNVAAVYHLGEQDGAFFYAMEFIQGRSLEAVLKEHTGPFPPAAALALVAQTAAGLTAAHRQQVIHRDLKPANLMVVEGAHLDHEDERTAAAGHRLIKVIDFGLARRFGESRGEDSVLTQATTFLGSPAYSSPEQCRGDDDIDGRSDLYSLGVILWELLAGQRPFGGRSSAEVLAKHQYEPPPVAQLTALPLPIVALLKGLLIKDRDLRQPQTAGELGSLLDGLWRGLAPRDGAKLPSRVGESTENLTLERIPAEGRSAIAPDFASSVTMVLRPLARGKPVLPPPSAPPGEAQPAAGKGVVSPHLEEPGRPVMEASPLAGPPKTPAASKTWIIWSSAAAVVGVLCYFTATGFYRRGDQNNQLPVAPHAAPALAGDSLPSGSKEAPFVNSLGMEFVALPGAQVLMCRTDTRVRDFRRFVQETNYKQMGGMFVLKPKRTGGGAFSAPRELEASAWVSDASASWENPGFSQTPDHPVVEVNWYEAKDFCLWLSKKEGRTYRLPTDQEWSAAAGSGKYPWGDQWPPPKGAGNFADDSFAKSLPVETWHTVSKGYDDGAARTSAVTAHTQNWLGLYDMSGNVWQWCEDEYQASMNSAEALEKYPFLKNERGSDDTALRLMRGASWASSNEFTLRSSYRDSLPAARHLDHVGFRCVLAAGPGG